MQNILVEGVVEKCNSEVFKQALPAGTTDEEKLAIENNLYNSTVDCSVLTVLVSCSPSAWRSEVTSKIQKIELIALLFPFRVRSLILPVVMRQSKKPISRRVWR